MIDDRQAADLADANLLTAARAWAHAAGGEAWGDDGVVVAASGVPLRSFNQAFITETAFDVGPSLARVQAFFDERGLRYRVRLREDLGDGFDAALESADLTPHGGIPSLALHPIERPANESAALEVTDVCDERTLRDHVAVVAAGFEWPPDVLGRVFTGALIGHPTWHAYNGYVDGRAVGASQLVVTESVAGVYYVATLPDARGRGFGEAMTRHAIGRGAADGCTVATLQASPMGLPIYERMGFSQDGILSDVY